ncbi:MAG: DNA internalization-related competence protein ComEC/Rec2 [Xanthomonadaceae bacterium]|nr:DNA internalization-related competence protein ComEC/Rec2 [Xanthomonadaceae bacterium]
MHWRAAWTVCWNCTRANCGNRFHLSRQRERGQSARTNVGGGAALRIRFPLAELFRPATALALLAGALAVQTLPALPAQWIDALVALAGIALIAGVPRLRWLGFFLLAAGWTMWRADLALSQRLPHVLEGADIVVSGRVHGLPRAQDDATRFEFDADSATQSGKPIAFAGRLRLAWYDTGSDAVPDIAPCSDWRLQVRLKRPRGGVNPGGFDFERYALEAGIVATGYVRESAENHEAGAALFCVDRLRARIGNAIDATLGDTSGAHLLRALAFGDQHAMNEGEWAVARATGIPHLIAISGLHIALFASFGVLLVRVFWKLAPRLTLRWPAPLIEAVASLAFAVAYALIAGFGLPTRRALVMIAALLVASLARRARAPVHGLALAVVALLAWNPACVLSAGFWLSFVGVAWLMFCLGGSNERRRWLRELVTAQGVASIGLLPLGIWFFGQSSLVGPIANLIAVPWICLFVLPLTVVASLLVLVFPALGVPLLQVSGWAMQGLWWLLEKMATWPGALWYFPEPSAWALALAMLGALWLLMPRGIPARALGAFLFLPLLWPARAALADGEFMAYMLDVGQGLSVVVRTRDHALVYDAGAKFPSGFDFGEATVVPALHALGIERIDRLIVSHGDNDHAGGAAAIVAAWPGMAVESGQPERLQIPAAQCLAGESWNWNGVAFRIVHPREPLSSIGNDRCCVLDVRSGRGELILDGDITKAVEAEVAAALAPAAPQLVLQVPHHGSKTSSSAEFIAALHPALGLISTGYLNRFHHPNPGVVTRYLDADVDLLDTAQTGFVKIRIAADAAPRVIEQGRVDRHPYWRED